MWRAVRKAALAAPIRIHRPDIDPIRAAVVLVRDLVAFRRPGGPPVPQLAPQLGVGLCQRAPAPAADRGRVDGAARREGDSPAVRRPARLAAAPAAEEREHL